MFYDFKQAVSNISNYNDILEILILYYFDKNMLIWYKHLIDNYNSEKKQVQIGIIQNMKQDSVSRKLKSVKLKIMSYVHDLEDNHKNFMNVLDTIDKYGTENQKEAMALFLQHKSFTVISNTLGISRYAAYLRVFGFFKRLLKINKKLINPILSIRDFNPKKIKN